MTHCLGWLLCAAGQHRWRTLTPVTYRGITERRCTRCRKRTHTGIRRSTTPVGRNPK